MASIITANRLTSGEVVYLAPNGTWVRDIAAAEPSADEASNRRIEQIAARAVAANHIIGPYLVDVQLEAGRPVPLSVREKIRAQHRPTV